MPRHTPLFKHGYPNGLLTGKTDPATNQVGQGTSRVCAALSATKLQIPAGQDSPLHRETNLQGRLGHWKQSINVKTKRRPEFGQKSPPEDKRRPKCLCARGAGRGRRANTLPSNGTTITLRRWAMTSQGLGQRQSLSVSSGRGESPGPTASAPATSRPHQLPRWPVHHPAPQTHMLVGVTHNVSSLQHVRDWKAQGLLVGKDTPD